MKLAVLGDSITRGTYWENGAYHHTDIAYPQLLQEKIGADDLLVVAVDGAPISSTSPNRSESALCLIYQQIKDSDVLLIAGGTNDYGNGVGVELGNIDDDEDYSFYGALDILYKNIRLNNPKARVYAVLPIPRKEEWIKNEKGYTLEDYRLAIEVKAKAYAISVIDTRTMPIAPNNKEGRKLHICDGLHPTPAGHKIYAEFIFKAIQNG